MNSWLADLERVFRYECKSCAQKHFFTMKTSDHDQDATETRGLCGSCGAQGLDYLGQDLAEKFNIANRTKEAFDQNGRLAYKVGDSYISKTKYDYMETGKIENQYTPAYREHLLKDFVKNEQLLTTEKNRRRAIVTKAPLLAEF